VEFVLGAAPGVLGELQGQADFFLSMDVLEHIDDDHHAFAELLATAKPGAHFLIMVPADPALWTGHDVSFGHYRRYDPHRLERLWQGLPATTVLLSWFNARLYPVVRAVRTVSRLRGKPFGRGSTDLAMPPLPLNAMLTRLFAGESDRLLETMAGRARPYPFGSSLIAVVRREAGPVHMRHKPAGLDSAFDAYAPR
jgi:SAM-dependent methyltransferase